MKASRRYKFGRWNFCTIKLNPDGSYTYQVSEHGKVPRSFTVKDLGTPYEQILYDEEDEEVE